MYLLCVCVEGSVFFFFCTLSCLLSRRIVELHSCTHAKSSHMYLYTSTQRHSLQHFTKKQPLLWMNATQSSIPLPLSKLCSLLSLFLLWSDANGCCIQYTCLFLFFFFSNRFRLCKGEKKKERAYILHTSCSWSYRSLSFSHIHTLFHLFYLALPTADKFGPLAVSQTQ